jgi:hypothetical protein
MGMDVYGLKPKIKGKRPEIDWNKPTTEEERNKYFKKLEKFEAENVGYYFRNNVWFWRPLANLITVLNEEWLTEEQKERLQDNSGFEFSEEEAIKIKLSLEKAINSGWLKKAEKQWKKEAKQAELWNAQINEQMEKLKKEAIKETTKANIVPRDYPPHLKLKWDKLWESEDRTSNYPVSLLQDLSQKLLKLFKSNETRVVELVASGEDTEATLILFFDKMTWQRDA